GITELRRGSGNWVYALCDTAQGAANALAMSPLSVGPGALLGVTKGSPGAMVGTVAGGDRMRSKATEEPQIGSLIGPQAVSSGMGRKGIRGLRAVFGMW
ncbi:hypothetical protein KIPB_006318, partial [Kipferlia bialata]